VFVSRLLSPLVSEWAAAAFRLAYSCLLVLSFHFLAFPLPSRTHARLAYEKMAALSYFVKQEEKELPKKGETKPPPLLKGGGTEEEIFLVLLLDHRTQGGGGRGG